MATASSVVGPVRPVSAAYSVRLAKTRDDLLAAQRLRFEVFNLELNEGLAESHALERDEDEFDVYCDHLLVEENGTGQLVGTYRLQTGMLAAAHLGYYSAQEFDLAPLETLRTELIELGRACVHREHRSLGVVHLLWRGIAHYAVERKCRYLMGCSSLTSQNAAEGHALYAALKTNAQVDPAKCVRPWPAYRLEAVDGTQPCPVVPRLLRAYLAIGARICGPPAIDRRFRTIDFLTLLDLTALTPAARNHFLRE